MKSSVLNVQETMELSERLGEAMKGLVEDMTCEYESG